MWENKGPKFRLRNKVFQTWSLSLRSWNYWTYLYLPFLSLSLPQLLWERNIEREYFDLIGRGIVRCFGSYFVVFLLIESMSERVFDLRPVIKPWKYGFGIEWTKFTGLICSFSSEYFLQERRFHSIHRLVTLFSHDEADPNKSDRGYRYVWRRK